jgi:ParB family chromosome partitioning protein
VLQPVLVRRETDGSITLVAGERRLRAAKRAGLEAIPAILTRGNPAEIALIENLQREDLRPVEEAEALARMMSEHGYTHEQLARVIGKGRSTITEALSLAKLPASIKEECRRADTYPRRLLVEIAKQETPERMLALFKTVQQGHLRSEQVRELTRRPVGPTRRSASALAMGRIIETTRSLKNINWETLTPHEREELSDGLCRLRETIEGLLRLT